MSIDEDGPSDESKEENELIDQEMDDGELTEAENDSEDEEELERMRNALRNELAGLVNNGEGSDSAEGFVSDDEESSMDKNEETENVEKDDESQSAKSVPKLVKEEIEDAEECPAKRIKLELDFTKDIDDDLDLEVPVNDTPPSSQSEKTDNCSPSKEPRKICKRMMEYRGTENCYKLPEGWIEIVHESGILVYMHRETRIVTLSRPYHIGTCAVRRYAIPLESIPCQQQKRMREEREKALKSQENGGILAQIGAPEPQIKTMDEIKKNEISPDELFDLAKERFGIKERMVLSFRNWRDVREMRKKESEERLANVMMDPQARVNAEVGLITIPGHVVSRNHRRPFVFNQVGKTSVTILHEYVQKVLRSILHYEFIEMKSALRPYSCTCYLKSDPRKRSKETGEVVANLNETLNGETTEAFIIGKGSGSSKKNAKLETATNALKVLIPGIKVGEDHIVEGNTSNEETAELFDMVAIEDPRIYDMSGKTGQHNPYRILQECLRRNSAWGDVSIHEESTRLAHQKHELKMKVAKHEAIFICSNKKEGRQRCSQILLQKLHPALSSWGALLRLYGASSNEAHVAAMKAKEEVVRLAPAAKNTGYVPNEAVLSRLRSEMSRGAALHSPSLGRPIGLHVTRLNSELDGSVQQERLVYGASIDL